MISGNRTKCARTAIATALVLLAGVATSTLSRAQDGHISSDGSPAEVSGPTVPPTVVGRVPPRGASPANTTSPASETDVATPSISVVPQPPTLNSQPSTLNPARFSHLPISFEPNQGQTDPQVLFLARGK